MQVSSFIADSQNDHADLTKDWNHIHNINNCLFKITVMTRSIGYHCEKLIIQVIY
jgi:hypothetical protein